MAKRGRPSPAERQALRSKRKQRREEAHEQRHAVMTERKRDLEVRRDEISGTVSVNPPIRHREPDTVIAHLGVTNSGKTYDGLQFLLSRGRGVFAAPLRMLAQEAHLKLSALAGEENVGLITGEERINEFAPIICSTTEMAPRRGDTLVLDEVQWACDPDRGHAWTRLLAGADYRHIRLVGSPDALPLIKSAFPQVEVRIHERLAPLNWIESRNVDDIDSGTVVIAFSRRSVLYITQQLRERYGRERVVCLYGAMPVSARRKVIDRVLSGQADIVVATDVLGHGVNLPAKTVLFAETSKFDGRDFRELEEWEAAQVAGRAGRYGLADSGEVGVLTGLKFFNPNPQVVRRALHPTIEVGDGLLGYRKVTRGRLRAALDDLQVERATELDFALSAWERVSNEALRSHEWLTIESTYPARGRLRIATQELSKKGLNSLGVDHAWKLACSPLDSDNGADRDIIRALANELATGKDFLSKMLSSKKTIASMELQEAEQAARTAAALRWASHAFPDELGKLETRAVAAELAASNRVVQCLDEGSHRSTIGECKVCHEECPPWFQMCDTCHAADQIAA